MASCVSKLYIISAASRELSQNPRLRKQFGHLLADLQKGIKRLNKELKALESGSSSQLPQEEEQP